MAKGREQGLMAKGGEPDQEEEADNRQGRQSRKSTGAGGMVPILYMG